MTIIAEIYSAAINNCFSASWNALNSVSPFKGILLTSKLQYPTWTQANLTFLKRQHTTESIAAKCNCFSNVSKVEILVPKVFKSYRS